CARAPAKNRRRWCRCRASPTTISSRTRAFPRAPRFRAWPPTYAPCPTRRRRARSDGWPGDRCVHRPGLGPGPGAVSGGARLAARVNALARHYDISLGENHRIAGFDCQAVMLAPKDNLRYGYKLYADVRSGMLLKAVTLDSSGDTVEQFMFTQLAIGPVSRDMVKPRQ